MKKQYFVLTVLTVYFLLLFYLPVSTKRFMPPTGKTGAPLEETCAKSTCHDDAGKNGNGTLTVSFGGADSTYLTENTYNITVTLQDMTKEVFGFQMTVLDTNDKSQGLFEVIDTITTTLQYISLCRQYIGHRDASSNASWTFSWKAPEKNVGDIIFYVAAIAGNNDSLNENDLIYRDSLILPCDSLSWQDSIGNDTCVWHVGIDDNILANHVNIYPTLLDGNTIKINYVLINHDIIETSMISIDGSIRILFDRGYQHAGYHNKELTIHQDLPPGLYIIQLKGNGRSINKKILIL
ncbi:MAG: hypothetical protein IH946_12710 [Bacteroidetes bacterium]|nr:hypothetical protein [Bacteroidota bacterium]